MGSRAARRTPAAKLRWPCERSRRRSPPVLCPVAVGVTWLRRRSPKAAPTTTRTTRPTRWRRWMPPWRTTTWTTPNTRFSPRYPPRAPPNLPLACVSVNRCLCVRVFKVFNFEFLTPQGPSVGARPPPSYRVQSDSGGPLPLTPPAGGAPACSSEEEQDDANAVGDQGEPEWAWLSIRGGAGNERIGVTICNVARVRLHRGLHVGLSG